MRNKGIIFYTDNRIRNPIKSLVREYLTATGLPIVSASLAPLDFGENEVIDSPRGYPTMVKQIISCLDRSRSKYVFFCEHDVLYPKAHFDFVPPEDNVFYYDINGWKWWIGSNEAVQHDRMMPLSSLCVNREYALAHYRDREKLIKEMGWGGDNEGEPQWARRMGYEPGTKEKRRGGYFDEKFDVWSSEVPMIDIRHKRTFSNAKTQLDHFKHKPKWFKKVPIDDIPGWDLKELFGL